MKSPATILNGINSRDIKLTAETRDSTIVAGKLKFFNQDAASKSLIVKKDGVDPIEFGSGDLEVHINPSDNGKASVVYYQDPNDSDLKLDNLTLKIGDKEINLAFDEEHQIQKNDPSNTMSFKTHPNSFKTEVELPLGIHNVVATAANFTSLSSGLTQKPELKLYDPDGQQEIGRNLAKPDQQRKAA